MLGDYTFGLIGPALCLAICGWGVPVILAKRLPEGIVWLGVNMLVSAMILLCVGGIMFFGLYRMGGMPQAQIFAFETKGAAWHFLRLGAVSALIWGPLMVLSIVNRPKYWVTKQW